MKRCFSGMAAILLAAVLILPCKVNAISAKSAVLLDAHTGRVLYAKDHHKKSLIASTTKIMTALVICEQCNVLDRVQIPKEAVGIEGSSMYLREGEILTVQELLYGMMLHSGNDAAVALAIYCGGTVEAFAELMNDKAYRLGLENTHFVNPNGLDHPEHYSTAYDLAVLSAYAMNNPIFARTVSAKSLTVGSRSLRNHNKLLWQFDGAEGIKTGYTKAAGRILVSSASRSGRRLIAVTIHAPNDWQDHKTLLETGFAKYSMTTLVAQGQCLGSVEIAGGSEGCCDLIAAEDFSYPIAADESWQVVLPPQAFVYAPVIEGQVAGRAYVCMDGQPMGAITLLYGRTVEQVRPDRPNRSRRLFLGGSS